MWLTNCPFKNTFSEVVLLNKPLLKIYPFLGTIGLRLKIIVFENMISRGSCLCQLP